jgi:hypothetical protein
VPNLRGIGGVGGGDVGVVCSGFGNTIRSVPIAYAFAFIQHRGPPPAVLQDAPSEGGDGDMAGMMAKLAAAEAEAEKLRTELKTSEAAPNGMTADEMFASRVDELSKQTPAKPKQRIDGGVPGHAPSSSPGRRLSCGSFGSIPEAALIVSPLVPERRWPR